MEIVNDDKQDKVRIVNVCKDSEWSNREVGDVGNYGSTSFKVK